VVTGAAQGIGQGICTRLLEEGATVVGLDLDASGPPPSIDDGRTTTLLQADVSVGSDVDAVLTRVLDAHGRIDVLVNNAGVNAHYDAATLSEAEWDRFMAVDLKSAWLTSRRVLDAMGQAGRGSIVHISSIHARLTMPGMFPYAAAKAGLVGLTRSMAADYGPQGVRVNAVCPGWTRTPLLLSGADEPDESQLRMLRRAAAAHPLRRIGEPAEIAAAVAFLASDDASFITGQELYVDGGLSAVAASWDASDDSSDDPAEPDAR
jgi:NAD(P)-dependent dehydrogenase (short-subunit alcohol dehydrogenase family)